MLFTDLHLKPDINQQLKQNNFFTLTPIQEKALLKTLNGISTIITSNTGTGKTLCYILPILNNISDEYSNIVIAPTQELARQIYGQFVLFNSKSKFHIQLVIGGHSDKKQSFHHKCPHVVVATPLWAMRVLQEKWINKPIHTLVLDEVDMMLDLGFVHIIDNVLKIINNTNLQKIACSATTHESLANQLKKYFLNTEVISETNTIWSNQQISHNLVYTSDFTNPKATLLSLLNIIKPFCCLIFANTINESENIYTLMKERNYNVCLINKNISTRKRKHIFHEINKHAYQYVVCTDLLARGVDISNIDTVINYGLPQDDRWYMHRVGRAGRNGKSGVAYTIYIKNIDTNINRLLKKHIQWSFYLLKNNTMINKPLKLRLSKSLLLDAQTNKKIRQIINVNSRVVKPCYKKKIKLSIYSLKQQKKREYIEKKYADIRLYNNIQRTKHTKEFNKGIRNK